MTDKQIIIDGVDVIGCEYFLKYGHSCDLMHPFGFCSQTSNCHYKQLKRKEQECERLKEEIKHYKQIAQYHGNLSVKYTNKSAKLKQTLAEIKEIAETISLPMGTGKSCNRVILAKQILQKISEVLNEN